jgi:uncharacterized membrane protein YeaQ/YmgE (transglycosylase-associated protein family)
MGLGLIGLLVMGAIVGFIADMIDRKHDNSWVANVVLGVVGSLAGGLLRGVLTGTDYLAFDFWSFIWALVGTLIVLFAYHAVRDRNKTVR